MVSRCRLNFINFVRPEQKFPSLESLVQQIQADIQQTREVMVRA